MIDDDDYWKGEPRGAVPLNREYLAKLVHALDDANAAIIALDVNETLTDPDHPEFDLTKATDRLMQEIARAAEKRTIVLAKVFSGNSFALARDIFQPYGICTHASRAGQWENPGSSKLPHLSMEAKRNIVCGFVAMPRRSEQVPPQISVEGEHYPIDSFSLAIARAWSPTDAEVLAQSERYTDYISMKTLNKDGVILSARQVLTGDPVSRHLVRFRPVIIGGNWHADGYYMGRYVDTHDTPIGPMRGAIINENYTEAILDGRLSTGLPSKVLYTLEVLAAVGATLLFAKYANIWAKVTLLMGAMIGLVLGQWLIFTLFGVYFEAFLPLVGLSIHSIFTRLIGEP
jgi:CHASE2 domain-containing sensor protein